MIVSDVSDPPLLPLFPPLFPFFSIRKTRARGVIGRPLTSLTPLTGHTTAAAVEPGNPERRMR